FLFSSRRRHTRFSRDWSSDVCSSDLSVYSTAYPLLKKRNWPFTIFLNTEPHDQEKKSFATWAQVREMADNGVTIANHSTAHNHRSEERRVGKECRSRRDYHATIKTDK